MLGVHLTNAKRQLGHIKGLVAIASRDRNFVAPYGYEEIWPEVGSVEIGYWRAYEHSAVLVRGYATFERFVLNAVEQWISWSQSHNPKLLLESAKARDVYERGIAEILRRKTEARFTDLDRGNLALGLNAFFGGKLPANLSLPVAPFFAVLPNLKLPKIAELFASVELPGLLDWLGSCPSLQRFCREEGYNYEEELSQIVDRRNEAAHGNDVPTDILGENELTSRLDFLIVLADAIFDFIIMSICRVNLGETFSRGLIGRVSRVWPRNGAFELTMESPVINTGASVLMLGSGEIRLATVKSLQLEGSAGLAFDVPLGTAVGVTMDFLPTENMKMIRLSSIAGIGPLLK